MEIKLGENNQQTVYIVTIHCDSVELPGNFRSCHELSPVSLGIHSRVTMATDMENAKFLKSDHISIDCM